MPRCGDFEHFLAEVESGGFRAAPREGEGDVAGAAAQIEGAVAGFAPAASSATRRFQRRWRPKL